MVYEEFFKRIKNNEAKVGGFSYKTVDRVWGSTVALDANTRINRLIAEPSAHFHENRIEDYILLSGKMIVYTGDLYEDMEKTIASLKETILYPGDKISIPAKTVHIPINIVDEGSIFIEVSHGVYEDEDAHRVYDKTGRDQELAKKWSELGYPIGISIKDLIPLARYKSAEKTKENKYSLEGAKLVTKPWGKEIWLELNDKYCYKRIYINAGHKTSFQYHLNKHETNYIISGKAEVWLENDQGVIERKIMNANDFFTVKPPRKHRVIAITDIILQEVSTPEVDDVIRINDEYSRPDGRIESEHNTFNKTNLKTN